MYSREQGDLLELYCGNGNFSLALAQNFERVLATELAKPSVEAAQFNIAANQIGNVQIIRMSAEEFTQAMEGKREFNRLKDAESICKATVATLFLSTHHAQAWISTLVKWCKVMSAFCTSLVTQKRCKRTYKSWGNPSSGALCSLRPISLHPPHGSGRDVRAQK